MLYHVFVYICTTVIVDTMNYIPNPLFTVRKPLSSLFPFHRASPDVIHTPTTKNIDIHPESQEKGHAGLN